jgi:hypothetical protein
MVFLLEDKQQHPTGVPTAPFHHSSLPPGSEKPIQLPLVNRPDRAAESSNGSAEEKEWY